jgi:hypothetical protein
VCPDVMERIQFYYIKDPTPQSQDIVEVEDFERPVILITGADLTPETNRFVKPSVNGLSLVAVAAFALGSFSFNDDFMARLNAMSEAGDTDISWLTQLAAPLFFSSLGIQLSHEMAHKVVALKDNVSPLNVHHSLRCPNKKNECDPYLNPFLSIFFLCMDGWVDGWVISLKLGFQR